MSFANRCECCGEGPVYVYSTTANQDRGLRVQYLQCASCGNKPGKRVIPLSQAPPRVRPSGSRITMRRLGK